MMICAWGLILFYSNSKFTKIWDTHFASEGKNERKKAYLSRRVNSEQSRHATKSCMGAYTSKDIPLWCSCGYTRGCSRTCNYPRRYYCLRPWCSTISFPSVDSILPYIVADAGGFVKKKAGLFTIRLRMICGEVKNYTEVAKKGEHLFAGVRGSKPQAAIVHLLI